MNDLTHPFKGASRYHLTESGGFQGKVYSNVRTDPLSEGERWVRAFQAKVDGTEATESKL